MGSKIVHLYCCFFYLSLILFSGLLIGGGVALWWSIFDGNVEDSCLGDNRRPENNDLIKIILLFILKPLLLLYTPTFYLGLGGVAVESVDPLDVVFAMVQTDLSPLKLDPLVSCVSARDC